MKRILDPLKADIYDFFVECGEFDLRTKKGVEDVIHAAVFKKTIYSKFKHKQIREALELGYVKEQWVRDKDTRAVKKVYFWAEDKMNQRVDWKKWLNKLKFWGN